MAHPLKSQIDTATRFRWPSRGLPIIFSRRRLRSDSFDILLVSVYHQLPLVHHSDRPTSCVAWPRTSHHGTFSWCPTAHHSSQWRYVLRGIHCSDCTPTSLSRAAARRNCGTHSSGFVIMRFDAGADFVAGAQSMWIL